MFKVATICLFLFSVTKAIPFKCAVKGGDDEVTGGDKVSEISSRYWDGSKCDEFGTHSVNQFGANICEYPGDTCDIEKYFSYPGGGGGVELCCNTHADCNYDKIKNYCHPEYKRCTDATFFNCSDEKGGELFDECK